MADQCQTDGLLNWVPLNTTFSRNLSTDNDYPIRSSMTSGLSYGLFASGDVAQAKIDFANFPFAAVKQSLEQFRSIQKYFYGDYYPLTEYTQANDEWMAYQLDLPGQGEGLVVVLKRPFSAYRQAVFPLQALTRDAVCEITNLDSGMKRALDGKELTDNGIEVRLSKRPDSVLLQYHKRS